MPYIENKFASRTPPGRVNYPLHFVQSAKELLREIILIIDLLWVSNLTLEKHLKTEVPIPLTWFKSDNYCSWSEEPK